MKHTIKTPQGTLTIEPAGANEVLVKVQKAPFPAFPLVIRTEDAQAVHVALSFVIAEQQGTCTRVMADGQACGLRAPCPDCGPALIDCGPGGVNAL